MGQMILPRLHTRADLTTPAELANNAAWYSLEGAPSDQTYIIDGSNRISLRADRSGNSGVNALICNQASGNYAKLTTGWAASTNPFTVSCTLSVPVVNPPTEVATIASFNANDVGSAGAAASAWIASIDTAGALVISKRDAAGNTVALLSIASFTTGRFGSQGVLCMVVTATTCEAFWNGVSVGSNTDADWSESTNSTLLGMSLGIANAARTYSGNLFSVRVYSAALDAAGVAGDAAGTVQANAVVNVSYALQAKLTTSFVCATGQTVTVVQTAIALPARIHGARDRYQHIVANRAVYINGLGGFAGYTSNFSAGTDSFAGIGGRSTVDGNQDNVSDGTVSFDDCLKVTQDSTNGGNIGRQAARASTPDAAYPGRVFTLTGRYYVPAGQTDINGIKIATGDAATTVWVNSTTVGAWTEFSATIIKSGASTVFVIFPLKNGADSYVASNSTDHLYVVDLVLTEVAVTVPYAYFDGSNDYDKSPPFPLAQPVSVYFGGSQVSWTSGDAIMDGNTATTLRIAQTTATPELSLNAGSAACANTGLAVGTRGVLRAIFNGASSSLGVNLGTAVTGNAGTASPNGIAVGARDDGAAPANITESILIVRSVADAEPMQLRIARWIMQRLRISG